MSRIRLYLDQLHYAIRNTRRFARQHYAFFSTFETRIGPYFDSLAGLRVLDLGCGRLFWLTLLIHSRNAQVTGIDTELIEPPGNSKGKYWRLFHHNGLERTLKTWCWDVIYSRAYYDELCSVVPFLVDCDRLDLRPMDVAHLDFPESTFDLIVSHEVFEHLPDVPKALCEMYRTMKPGAIAYIYIHNYTSLSGGHHIRWKYPDREPPSDVPPWDHLRENRFPEVPSYLNRWRLQEYRQAFERRFRVLEWYPTEHEGERFLTPELSAELSDYSKEELLTKGVTVVAGRKP